MLSNDRRLSTPVFLGFALKGVLKWAVNMVKKLKQSWSCMLSFTWAKHHCLMNFRKLTVGLQSLPPLFCANSQSLCLNFSVLILNFASLPHLHVMRHGSLLFVIFSRALQEESSRIIYIFLCVLLREKVATFLWPKGGHKNTSARACRASEIK